MQQGFNIWLPSSVGKVAGALEPGFLLSKTELKWGLRGEKQRDRMESPVPRTWRALHGVQIAWTMSGFECAATFGASQP